MLSMKATQDALPLPELTLFCTRSAAALRLKVDAATISRWIAAGKLSVYRPRCAPTENGPRLLLCTEVDEFARARDLTRGIRGRA
jgi:hypothetical protein